MASLNRAELIGHLGQTPELKYTGAGHTVSSFSIATNESWKDKDGNVQERTDWHNVVVWGKLAEICHQYLKKGQQIYIDGRLQTRSYDDKNTGTKRWITEIVVNKMLMLGSKPADQQGPSSVPQEAEMQPPEGSGSDLPF